MNSSGVYGLNSTSAVASGCRSAGSRSPIARLPTWSWFWLKTMNRSGGRWPAARPNEMCGSRNTSDSCSMLPKSV